MVAGYKGRDTLTEIPGRIQVDHGTLNARRDDDPGAPAHAYLTARVSVCVADDSAPISRLTKAVTNGRRHVGTTSHAYVVERVWKMPHAVPGHYTPSGPNPCSVVTRRHLPHSTCPATRTLSDGAKTGIKMTTIIQASATMNVRRQPKRSCAQPFRASPMSCPQTEALLRPLCQLALGRVV